MENALYNLLENRIRIDTHYYYRLDPVLLLMICDFHVSHKSIRFPIKFCIRIVFNFSWGQ